MDILSNLNLAALPADETVLVVSERKTKRYLQFDDTMRLVGWKNIETGEVKGREARSLAFSGIHVLGPSMFPLLEDWPQRFPIMDFYLAVCNQQLIFYLAVCNQQLIRGYEACNLRLLDVGKLDTLEQAEFFLKQL